MTRRVVVTGMGIISAAGLDVASSWARMVRGPSGIDKLHIAGTPAVPVPIGGEVRGFDAERDVGPHKSLKFMARPVRFVVAAARQALADSGLAETAPDPERIGVYVGSGGAPPETHEFFRHRELPHLPEGRLDTSMFGVHGFPFDNPFFLLLSLSNAGAFFISTLYHAKGANNNFVNGDTASALALGEAFRAIKRDEADVIVTAGYDSLLSSPMLAGFHAAGLLTARTDDPSRAIRPFDRERDGFALGEGAGVLILEERSHAQARGARIYAEIVGYACTAESFPPFHVNPSGQAAAVAIARALREAQCPAGAVGYVCAHGDATKDADHAETVALRQVFGPRAREVPVSSVKPITGYVGAASGVIEALVTVLAVRDQVIPPTLNHTVSDPACDLDYVPEVARQQPVEVALTLNRSLAGQHTAVVIRKIE